MCPSSQVGRRSARALLTLLVPALLVVGLPTSAEAAPDLSVGLPVLDLEFEGDLTDSAATPHPVTSHGAAPTYVAGTVAGAQALRFAGGTYLDLGTRVDLQPSNLSYSFWLKPNGAMQGEEIITWNKEAYNSDGWYLSSEGDGSPLAISIGPGSNQPYKVAVASTDRASFFPADTWTHVVVSFDTSTKQVRFFRNGLPVKTRVAAAVGGSATGTITGSEAIRKTMGYNGPYNGAYLDGALDHVELFDGVVTTTDVAKLFEAGGGQLNREALARADSEALSVPSTATLAVSLPAEGGNGSSIAWASSDPAVISPAGKVTPPEAGEDDAVVTLTSSTRFADGPVITRDFTVTVPAAAGSPLLDSGVAGVSLADSYLVNATQQEQQYLLELEPKKFLYWNYRVAGLPAPADSDYGGWEDKDNPGGNFRGHAFGHYMSALAMAWSSAPDQATRSALRAKIVESVDGLAEVQAAYDGTSRDGYLAPFDESALAAVEGRGTSTDPVIVPYYNLHKILAGLLAVHQYVGGTEGAKALAVAQDFGEYLYRRVSTLQNRSALLSVEYGGMNDALYSLYEQSGGNPHFKVAAEAFDETSLFRDLAAGKDVLPGRHANTTIPKLIGALKRYTLFTQNPSLYATLTDAEKADLPMYLAAAQNFFRIVRDDHTYATGANSQAEHFHDPDSLHQFATARGESGNAETAETCNEYNMLKLSRELFKITFDKQYADYYENTFINTILSSQNPDTGMVTYFQAMAPGYNKLYSMPFTDFWCCLGTGIESFAKLGDSIYYRGDGTVWVNMFLSSTFQDPASGLAIIQSAHLPNDPTVTFTVAAGTGGGTGTTGLRLRVPDWIAGSPTLKVNGATVTPRIDGGYVVLTGLKAGDSVAYTMPMTVRAVTTEDDTSFAAFKYGPVLLSAGLGTKGIDRSYPVGIGVRVSARDDDAQQVVVVDSASVDTWLADAAKNVVRVADTADGQVQFALRGTLNADQLRFTPHYQRHDERYGLYMTYEVRDSQASQQRIRDAKERDRAAAFTTDSLTTFDNNNFEAAKGLRTTGTSSVGLWMGQNYRDAQAGGSFSYDLTVDPSQPATLGVRYFSGDSRRTFDVYVDDVKLKSERPDASKGTDTFYWQDDTLPAAATADGKVTVRFQSTGGLVGGVYGVRTMRPLTYDADPGLSKLSANVGTLAPAFAPATTSYTLYVPTGTTQTALDLDPHLSTGLVTVDGALVDDTQPRTVDLTPGTAKQLSIVSYAQDHTTKRAYTLRVVEGTAPVETGNGTGQPGTTDPGTTGPTTGQAPAVQVEATTTTTVKAPKTVRPGRKVQLVVAVAGGAPGAPVQITEKGKVIATVTLGADGTAKVKVRLKGKKTRHALLVTYLGTSTTATSADTVTVKVKSPRR
ncbi:beta-L-arabinofuranosidase domain-containing protein [Nocardioides flavescens]|uniref:LamG-like jellyroll fold domain-containing protein n=1 Tax=Nocardioides flavescens TaxID=2691959 RepID=A0A6L7ES45_9ACTN|nr:beta-L-arabinofuranosidase domain-containing protein [Nocardioides flavescens]MXG90143.1 hypothetical protein [Nocardioides flavescens]